MKVTILELRKQPKLVFTLNDNDFHLIDDDNPLNNGGFKPNSIVSVKILKGKTNWFISILSLIIDFIFDSSSFDNYNEKDKLIIQLKNSKLEILLFQVDRKEAEIVTKRFKTIINSKRI